MGEIRKGKGFYSVPEGGKYEFEIEMTLSEDGICSGRIFNERLVPLEARAPLHSTPLLRRRVRLSAHITTRAHFEGHSLGSDLAFVKTYDCQAERVFYSLTRQCRNRYTGHWHHMAKPSLGLSTFDAQSGLAEIVFE